MKLPPEADSLRSFPSDPYSSDGGRHGQQKLSPCYRSLERNGLELARVFARNKNDLIVNSGSERVADAASDLELGVEGIPVIANQASYDGVEQLWRAVEQSRRALDAVAINAGIGA